MLVVVGVSLPLFGWEVVEVAKVVEVVEVVMVVEVVEVVMVVVGGVVTVIQVAGGGGGRGGCWVLQSMNCVICVPSSSIFCRVSGLFQPWPRRHHRSRWW